MSRGALPPQMYDYSVFRINRLWGQKTVPWGSQEKIGLRSGWEILGPALR